MNQSIISSSILKRFLLIFTLLFTQQSFAGDCDPNDANCVQITGTPINGETPIVSVGFEEMDPMNGINLAPGVGGSTSPKETKEQCIKKVDNLEAKCLGLYGGMGAVTLGFCQRLSSASASWGTTCKAAVGALSVTAYRWCSNNAKRVKAEKCK